MSFFEHTNLKLNITRVWGRTYSTPIYNSRIPLKEAFSSSFPQYELIFFPESDFIISYNGVTKHITNSSVVFLPHCMTDILNPAVKEYRCEKFLDTGHFAIQFTCDTPLASQMETFDCSQFKKDIEIYFEKLKNVWELKPIGYNSQALAYLYQIFALLEKRTSPQYLPQSQYALIEKSINYINENYLSENIDCENLAKMCQISTSYYNRIFKKKFSITPKQYVLTKKLNYAIDLLTTTNTPVTAISEMSGFSSLYYFSKIFKKYYNISPQNYRDELVKKL